MTKETTSMEELSQMRILYVEDDEVVADAFMQILKRMVKSIQYCKNGKEGLQTYSDTLHDIIITDIKMPNMSGLEMSKEIRKKDNDVPIIIVSAYSENEYLKDAFEVGITYYVNKPINRLVLMRVLNESAKLVLYKHKQNELIQNYEESIDAFVNLIERRDRYTAGHSNRVAKYSRMIAEVMNIDEKDCLLLENAAKLHDIGKIEIPDSILLNPNRLSSLEYSIVQEHLNSGYEVLSKIKNYQNLAEIMRYHHERYDGSGYPLGIKGEEIPLLSRIMMIADSFDAMTTNRIYKPRMSVKEALEEIQSLSAIDYHPEIIPFALEALSKVVVDVSETQLPKNELEKKKFSYFFSDLLTGLYNENYLQSIITKKDYEDNAASTLQQVSIIDLHRFSAYNKTFGWQSGNDLISRVSQYMLKTFSDSLLFRIHGDQFYLFSSHNIVISEEDLNAIIDEQTVTFDIIQYDFKEFINNGYYKLENY